MKRVLGGVLWIFLLVCLSSTVFALELKDGTERIGIGSNTGGEDISETDGKLLRDGAGRASAGLAAPEMVSAVSAGYQAIRVTWKPVPGAQSYHLYYKGGSVKAWTIVKMSIPGTSFTHTSYPACPLNTGTVYSYTVRAVSGNVLSGFAPNVKSAKPVPGKSEIVTAQSAAYNQVMLIWKAVPGASAYRVYRKEGGSWKYIAQTSSIYYVHVNSAKHPVKTGVSYTYRVRAIRKTGGTISYGAYSAARTVKAVPAQAVLQSVSSGEVFGKITVQWKAAAGATGYFVYRKAAGAKKWQKIASVKGGGTTAYVHEDSGAYPIQPDTTYYYTVRSYTSDGKTYGSYDKKGLSVKIPPASGVTDAQLRQKAREVVAKITTPDMTKRQKLEACFRYIRNGSWNRNLFPDRTRKDWKYKCAMDELTTREHNCYGFSHGFAALAREVGCTPYIIEIPLYHCFVQIDGKYWDNLGWLMGADSPSKPYTEEMKTKF